MGCVLIKFIGKEKWLNAMTTSLIFSVPVLTIGLVWTNSWHHLHYRQVFINQQGSFPILDILPGTGYIHCIFI
jgi:hypothetical protein